VFRFAGWKSAAVDKVEKLGDVSKLMDISLDEVILWN
jgi:hypothetical protein